MAHLSLLPVRLASVPAIDGHLGSTIARLAALAAPLVLGSSLLGCATYSETAPSESVGYSADGPVTQQPFFTPFRSVDDGGWASGSTYYRARVLPDGHMFMYPPSGQDTDASVSFLTVVMRRGEASFLRGAPLSVHIGDRSEPGALLLNRGEVTEIFQPEPKGVAQSWRFTKAPSGSGDLLVRVHVSGVSEVEHTSAGLKFHLSGGQWGVVYEHPSWVDASHVKTPLIALWEGENVEFRVPTSVIDSSTFPATLDGSGP